MFLADAGEYMACGLFTKGHFLIASISLLIVFIMLFLCRNFDKNKVNIVIRISFIVIWLLEIIKIIYLIPRIDLRDVNAYIPLYYCSLLLYSLFLSSLFKRKIKRCGDVFLATGAIIGGIVFIIFPTTSLPTYPVFHFISIHSFLYHGLMVYLGLLINITNYINIEKKDIKYFSLLVGIICLIAYEVNLRFDSNLMFISKNFSGTPIEILYKYTGNLFTLVMSLGQMTLPFYIVYYIRKLFIKKV